MYRPMQDANALVLDAVNIDLMTMHKADNDILQQMVLDFVSAYGFLGYIFLKTTLKNKKLFQQRIILLTSTLLKSLIFTRKVRNPDGLLQIKMKLLL